MKKPSRKINVLYILAFQLLGFTSVLFLESEPSHQNSQEINIALEDTTSDVQEFVINEVCTSTGCKRIGP